jgi:hypothetical protein
MPRSNPVSHERDALLGGGIAEGEIKKRHGIVDKPWQRTSLPENQRNLINRTEFEYLQKEHLKALKNRESELEGRVSVLRTLLRPIKENRKDKKQLGQVKQEIREIEIDQWKPSIGKYRRLAHLYKMKGTDVSKWGTDAARYLGGSSR